MIVTKQFRKRGRWSLLLALALMPALTSCLESEDRPVIDPKDVATIQGLNGFYDPALGTDASGDTKTYYRFEKRPDNRYAISGIVWNPATDQIEETHITEEGVFLKLSVNVPGSESFLGIRPPESGCVGSCPTQYFEVRKTDADFFVAFYGVSKDGPAIKLAKKIGKTKRIVLSEKKITGDLRSRTLKELFSDGNFRKGLELEFIPLRPLSPAERQRLAAAKTAPSRAPSERIVRDFAGAPESDTRDNSTMPELADLLQQLRAKVTSEGPFDLPIYERLAATLQKADAGQAQTQELLANARDFAGGKVRASMFVAYLKDALPPGDTSPEFTSTPLHRLQQKALSGDLWAKYFLARAYFLVASDLRGQELASSFEAMGFPEEIRDYWETYQLVLEDLDFGGSFEEAAKLAEEGAVKGSPPLTNLLGVMTLNGLGVAKDEAKGLKLIRQAADGGFPIAILLVGNMYRDGKGVVKDEAEAARWYRKGADLGNASAMTELAIIYANGQGVSRDEAAAVHWYQKAADLGNATAMRNLGGMYGDGRGVPRDEAAAVRWYQKAAELGDADAMNNLGVRYMFGHGVPKDEVAAARWYQKGAELGNATAMSNLGAMYSNGLGVPKDEAAAVRWFQKAAELGNATAMYNLGLAYERGKSVGQDLKQALEWYEKAAKLGNESGKEAIQRLASLQPGSAPRSAQEWAERYKNAATIDTAEFMKRLPPVRLEVRVNGTFLDVVPRETFYANTLSALRNQGIKFDGTSPVTLRVTYHAQLTKFVTTIERQSSRYGSSTDETITPVMAYRVLLEAILPAPILRKGHFFRLNIIPMAYTYRAWGQSCGTSVYKGCIQETVDELIGTIPQMIETLRTPDNQPRQSLPPLSLGDSAREEALYDEYNAASRTTGDELDRIFVGLDGIRQTDVELYQDASKFVNKESVHQSWMESLPEAKLPIKQDSPAEIYHKVWAIEFDASLTTAFVGALGRSLYVVSTYDAIVVKEKGVVFELNGQFVRKDVVLWEDWNIANVLSSQVRSKLPEMATGYIRNFAREARFRR